MKMCKFVCAVAMVRPPLNLSENGRENHLCKKIYQRLMIKRVRIIISRKLNVFYALHSIDFLLKWRNEGFFILFFFSLWFFILILYDVYRCRLEVWRWNKNRIVIPINLNMLMEKLIFADIFLYEFKKWSFHCVVCIYNKIKVFENFW